MHLAEWVCTHQLTLGNIWTYLGIPEVAVHSSTALEVSWWYHTPGDASAHWHAPWYTFKLNIWRSRSHVQLNLEPTCMDFKLELNIWTPRCILGRVPGLFCQGAMTRTSISSFDSDHQNRITSWPSWKWYSLRACRWHGNSKWFS